MPARGSRRTPDEQQLQQRRAFGDRLRILRTERDLSQERLGEAAGLDRQTIGYYERAVTNPGLDELTSIAKALGVETWQLLYPR